MILQWHLEEDGRAALRVVENELVPALPITSAEDQAQVIEARGSPVSPDKIVIYCAFVSSWPQLCKVRLLPIYTVKPSPSDPSFKVLDLHDIKYLTINGRMSATRRSQTVDQFRASDHAGYRVLILSNVGQTGLNLPCAHILCILVRQSRASIPPFGHSDIHSRIGFGLLAKKTK